MSIKTINDLKIKDNKLIIDMEEKCEFILLRSFNNIIKIKVENNQIDLAGVIKNNNSIMNGESIYSICTEVDDEIKELIINQVAPKSEDYICKNLKIDVDDSIYSIDIYIDNKNHIQIKITEVVDLKVEVENMYISNDKFNLSMSLHKEYTQYVQEDNGIREYDVKAIYIPENVKLLAINENNHIIEHDVKSNSNNIVDVEIDLNKMIQKEDCTFRVKLVVDSKVLEIKVDECVKFKKITTQKNEDVKSILVKSDYMSKNLLFAISGEININPIMSDVVYDEDKVSIYGKLSSNMEFYKYDKHEVYLMLKSRDNSITIENKIEINNDEFVYTIEKNELFDLRDANSGIWDISIQVREDEEVICENELDYPCDECGTLFKNTIISERDAVIFEAYTTKDNGRVALKINNRVTITQILSMRVRNNDLEVKFRTKENVEALLDGKDISTNLKNDKEELQCKGVKKKGKKTYICYYSSKDLKSFIDESLDRGISLITTIGNQEWTNNLSQINKYTIFYNKLDVIHSSKKYKKICTKLYEKVFLKLPIKKKRVLFESFLGRNVSGNPKYIYNYLVENKLDRKYQLIWILNDLDEEIPGKVKKVKRKSLKYYYYMATSGYWIFNVRQGDEIVKRKGTTYLQTWHGTPLKRLASDMFNVDMGGVTNLDEYKEKFFRNSRRWDYLLAQNDYSAEIFERAFNFKKEMIYGYPANDILYTKNNESDINAIKDKLGIPKDKKVIIYAPTWREDNFFKKGHYKMSIELDLDKMQKELGDEYVVIIRAHYLIASSINVADYKGFVYDFSQGFDIQELYLISDILITDYSSVMFDFANLKRPMIFFTYDLEKYRDSLRGFYFDFEKVAPGKIAMTTDEIVDTIANIDEVNEEYKDRYEAFYNKFCHVDNGESAKNIVEKIFK